MLAVAAAGLAGAGLAALACSWWSRTSKVSLVYIRIALVHCLSAAVVLAVRTTCSTRDAVIIACWTPD